MEGLIGAVGLVILFAFIYFRVHLTEPFKASDPACDRCGKRMRHLSGLCLTCRIEERRYLP